MNACFVTSGATPQLEVGQRHDDAVDRLTDQIATAVATDEAPEQCQRLYYQLATRIGWPSAHRMVARMVLDRAHRDRATASTTGRP